MKRVLIVSLLVFALVFLLYPTKKYDRDAGCMPPPNGTPVWTKECRIPQTFDSFGGGITYLQGSIEAGLDEGKTFHAPDAFKFALLSGAFAGGAVYVWQRQKNKAPRK